MAAEVGDVYFLKTLPHTIWQSQHVQWGLEDRGTFIMVYHVQKEPDPNTNFTGKHVRCWFAVRLVRCSTLSFLREGDTPIRPQDVTLQHGDPALLANAYLVVRGGQQFFGRAEHFSKAMSSTCTLLSIRGLSLQAIRANVVCGPDIGPLGPGVPAGPPYAKYPLYSREPNDFYWPTQSWEKQ